MILALIEQPWTEIAAFISVVSLVVGFIGALILLWLSTKFVKKSAYYQDLRERMLDINALQERVTAIEQELKLAKQPITTMQKSLDEVKNELVKLTDGIAVLKDSMNGTITGLKDSVTEGMHALDNRTTALEAKRGKVGAGG